MMNTRLAHVLLIGAVPIAIPTKTESWGANGHRVVAEIASRHLGSASASAVARILGPGELRLARAATWPDEIRSNPRWRDIAPWHYMTVEDTADYRSEIGPAATIDGVRNVAQAIQFFADVLRGNSDKRAQFEAYMSTRVVEPYLGSVEAAALSLIVHFVGDVHQPLHVGRGQDLGGNRIRLNWFESPSNLHSVWDQGLIEKQALSFTELATMIDVTRPEDVREWQDDPLDAWVRESMELRRQVYHFPALPDLAYDYAYQNTETVNGRLLIGGVRLAGLLDSVFR